MAARLLRAAALPLSAALLAGCSSLNPLNWFSSPPDTISLPPAQGVAAAAEDPGVATRPVRFSGDKPGCKGECPHLEIDSLAFPDLPALTQAVDSGLAGMTGVDANLRGSYHTIAEYTDYFWRTAQSRDRTDLKAVLRGVTGDVISVELLTGQYLTGAAHGIPATHFLNWSRAANRELSLDDLLIPGRRPQYVEALRAAHERWLAGNPDYLNDPANYRRLWPFAETDNVALTRQGLVAKYDAYSIAPYSHGQPELLLDYEALRGILRPAYLPAP